MNFYWNIVDFLVVSFDVQKFKILFTYLFIIEV